MSGQLTARQIERQDCVDNAIFNLIQELSPVPVEWDMEIIAEVREVIFEYLKEKIKLSEMQFYPFIRRGRA